MKTTLKTKYPEIKEIKEDLNSLKSNVIELTKHLRNNGSDQAEEIQTIAKERFENLKVKSQVQLAKVEARVKEKPTETMAMAFAAGALASFLFNRKS